VDKYQGRLFGLALMILRDRSAAEEITQDAFIRAYTHIAQYDTRRPFYPWLATIAVRLSQNRLRGGRAQVLAIDDAGPSPEADTALDMLLADERNRRLWRAVATLPYGERTAVILFYNQEMSVRDIATALGVTAGTVKTLLFRARRHLRSRLEALTGAGQTERI
jgi:RNA polymerase sigma-70 factor (ECF subfamily)